MSAPPSPLVWTDDGSPRSRLYGDIYFSREDGLAEARAVFLAGCRLPQAWQGRRRFVVGELGFGTGLNILALLHLWRATKPPGAHLHIFSVEAHPLTATEAARALAAWPELADLTQFLLSRWPGQARGLHRVDLPEVSATLDLAVMEAGTALAGWTGQADAWFLDGFSPALNPAMWEAPLLREVARHSAPGARAATFTVAGDVRRGLEAAGFEVAKRPGHGRKRERLEAWLPGQPTDPPVPRVAVVGAGIAGASVVRALRALGCEPCHIEAQHLGAGASGNPAALVTPRLDAGLGPLAALFAQAYGRALRRYGTTPSAVLARGVRHLASGSKDPARFARIAESDLFEPGALVVGPGTLGLSDALTVDPAAILSAWCGEILRAQVTSLSRDDGVWSLWDPQGDLVTQAEVVILAGGYSQLWPSPDLRPVRGQVSWTTGGEQAPATAWGGYLIPTARGLLFGATHDRDDEGLEVRQADHARNRATLAEGFPDLAARLELEPLEGRAALRASTTDYMPLAGPAPGAEPGLLLLGGFGSRGFCLAPLLGEYVAALALGAPSPLSAEHIDLVDPDRFARRAARRGRTVG